MSRAEDYERIQMFCMKLSNYVRYLFTDGFSVVPLETECAMVREYVEIQNIRRRTENAKVKEDIPEDFAVFGNPAATDDVCGKFAKARGGETAGHMRFPSAGKAVLEAGTRSGAVCAG